MNMEIEFWMLNIMHNALSKEYISMKNETGITAHLSAIADKHGLESAKEEEKRM